MRGAFVAMTKPYPTLGLGCSKMGSFGNPVPLSESAALVRAAFDMGVTLFDTANIYGQGDSERAIAAGLRGVRDRAIIVTKAGQTFSTKMRLMMPFKPLLRPLLARRAQGASVTAQRAGQMRTDWSPAALSASLDGSLRRLRTDHVDLFLLHSPPAPVIAQAETTRLLDDVLASGRARAVGVACDDLAAVDAALALPTVTALELDWHALSALAHREQIIRDRRIAIIAREVLVQQPGIDPIRAIERAAAHPVVTTTLIGSRRTERVRAIAARLGKAPATGEMV
jgi:pyridoxine 4-dehydrogenase